MSSLDDTVWLAAPGRSATMADPDFGFLRFSDPYWTQTLQAGVGRGGWRAVEAGSDHRAGITREVPQGAVIPLELGLPQVGVQVPVAERLWEFKFPFRTLVKSTS